MQITEQVVGERVARYFDLSEGGFIAGKVFSQGALE
jgi:hypothetical protein